MVLRFRGRIFSAHIQGVPLGLILKKLQREKGIWFKGADSLLDEKINVQFAALPLEDGMKRILTSLNYCLVFGQNGELDGVVILGKATPDVSRGEGKVVGTRRGMSSTPQEGPVTTVGVSDSVRDSQPPGGPAQITKKEFEIFQVMDNVSPPGDSLEVTPQELEKFKVMRNCPPHGNRIEASEKELGNFKVIKNCPPPGR
jgi:hypothetical protein